MQEYLKNATIYTIRVFAISQENFNFYFKRVNTFYVFYFLNIHVSTPVRKNQTLRLILFASLKKKKKDRRSANPNQSKLKYIIRAGIE